MKKNDYDDYYEIEENTLDDRKKMKSGRKVVHVAILMLFLSAFAFLSINVMVIDNTSDENPNTSNVLEETVEIYSEGMDVMDREMTLALNSSQWQGKSFILIDTSLDYPENMAYGNRSTFEKDYDALSTEDINYLLPYDFSSYEFDSINILYTSNTLDAEAVNTLIKSHPDERFIIEEIESDQMMIDYTYRSVEENLLIRVNLNFEFIENIFSFLRNDDKSYKTISLEGFNTLLIESNALGYTYRDHKGIKVVGINHYQSSWYEPKINARITIKPYKLLGGVNKQEKVDGELVELDIYPEGTKDVMIHVTQALHDIINEID
jgi:hypothetical protein